MRGSIESGKRSLRRRTILQAGAALAAADRLGRSRQRAGRLPGQAGAHRRVLRAGRRDRRGRPHRLRAHGQDAGPDRGGRQQAGRRLDHRRRPDLPLPPDGYNLLVTGMAHSVMPELFPQAKLRSDQVVPADQLSRPDAVRSGREPDPAGYRLRELRRLREGQSGLASIAARPARAARPISARCCSPRWRAWISCGFRTARRRRR